MNHDSGAIELKAVAEDEPGRSQSPDTQTRWVVGVVLAAVLLLAGWSLQDLRANGIKAIEMANESKGDYRDMKLENKFRDERLDRFERKLDLLLQDRGIRP